MDCRLQAPRPRDYLKAEHWVVLPYTPPEDLLDQGIESMSPASCTGRQVFTTSTAKAGVIMYVKVKMKVAFCRV